MNRAPQTGLLLLLLFPPLSSLHVSFFVVVVAGLVRRGFLSGEEFQAVAVLKREGAGI